MFDDKSWKSRPDHAVCSVETGLHMIKAIKDVRHNTHVSFNVIFSASAQFTHIILLCPEIG